MELPKGFYPDDDLAFLAGAVNVRRPSVLVEIGTHAGRSAAAMLGEMPEGAVLHCVDPWVFRPHMDESVRKIGDGFENKRIVTIRGHSCPVARSWSGPKIDLIHVDGDHRSLSVYLDIREWLPHLSAEGFFVGHDWFIPSVRFGVQVACDDGLLSDVGLSSHKRQGKPSMWWGLPGRSPGT